MILAAGFGKRMQPFTNFLPKPLIEVNNKPMIQWVIESLNLKANYIFIIHFRYFNNFWILS